MNAPFPSPSAAPQQPGVLRRFFGRKAQLPDENSSAPTPRRQLFRLRHSAAMEQLMDWLADAGLPPSPDALMLGWHVTHSGGELTQSMIQDARDGNGDIPESSLPALLVALGLRQDRRAMKAMVDQMQSTVGSAHAVTGESCAAFADYRAALSVPSKALQDPMRAIRAVAELQELTKTLLERTRRAEEDLRTTANVMGELRHRLAETQREALSDPLTQLPNRRAFDLALADAMIKAQEQTGTALSIAFVDIDHFKLVNDAHGHAAGDRVLRHVADVLATLSGDNCHVARHGGEEFALIFAHLNASQAHQRLDNARSTLSATLLCNRENGDPIGHLSFSAGVAQYHPGETSAQLLARADTALYSAKNAGRNCVRIGTKECPAGEPHALHS